MTSLTAAERRNPPPRQKACAACIKAKRRCDYDTPSCLRCSMRQIPCQYPSRPAGSTARQRRPPASASVGRNVMPPTTAFNGTGWIAEECPAFDLIGAVAPDHTFSTPTTMPATSYYEEVSSAACLDPTPATLNKTGLVQFPDGYLVDVSSWELELEAQTPALASVPLIQSIKFMTGLIASRLQFAIDKCMQTPRSMVETLSTPWSHHSLYKDRMPNSIRDAQAACALHLAKNDVNAPVIMRSIESYCQTLLASPSPISAFDTLAHAHALLLYQIIRLFDGDMLARVSAERDIPALESSAFALLAHVRFEEPTSPASPLALSPFGPTRDFWKQWLFQESAKRTILFIFFFLQTYRMVSVGQIIHCDSKIELVTSWTFSAHLWLAATPVEFAKAWEHRNHFVISNAGFAAVLSEAKADDVDLFGRMLLAAMMGHDEADAWLAQRGGSLREEVRV